jgi:two-component system nitrate/nitrite response regulator NarL
MAIVTTAAIVDAQPLFVEGVAQIVRASGMSVIGIGSTGSDATSIAAEKKPDLLILDIKITGCGMEAARQVALLSPQTKIVFLTDSEQDEHVSTVLRDGAKGYILKSVAKRDFTKIICDIASGRAYMDPSLAARLIGRRRRSSDASSSLIAQLTIREREILECVAGGKTNKEVAGLLRLGEKTIKHHMTNIMQKLEVRNRLEATIVLQREQAASVNGVQRGVSIQPISARSGSGGLYHIKRD